MSQVTREQLEASLHSAQYRLNELDRRYEKLREQYAAVMEQRAELIEACKAALSELEPEYYYDHPTLRQIRTALEKAGVK